MRVLAVVLVFLALLAGGSGLALSIRGNEIAANTASEIQTLLLDGKTASAKAARKTAGEVATLLIEQSHSVRSQRATKAAILAVEKHLDATIRSAVDRAASKVANEFRK